MAHDLSNYAFTKEDIALFAGLCFFLCCTIVQLKNYETPLKWNDMKQLNSRKSTSAMNLNRSGKWSGIHSEA